MEHEPAPPPALPPRETSWSKVLGILCIVFGGLGLLSRISQVAMTAMLRFLPIDEWMKPPGHLVVWMVAISTAGLSISLMDMILGIQLVRRRRGVRALAIALLVLVTVLIIPGLYLQHEVQQAQLVALEQHMAQQPQGSQSPPGAMMGFQMGLKMGPIASVLGGLFAIGWPVFLIVWLFVPTNRAVVDSWKDA